MTTFVNAKRLLWASFAFCSLGFSLPVPFPVECGNYQASGRILQNSQGDFVLAVGGGRGTYREFILLGGGVKKKLTHLRTHVQVELYVPSQITLKNSPFVYLQALKPAKRGQKDSWEPIKKNSCGQFSEYRKS